MKDQKESLTSPGRKPDTTHFRLAPRVYAARACEYGDHKYERANYLRPAGEMRDEFLRHRNYLRAAIDHASRVLDAMEFHQALDPNLKDTGGMIAAIRTPDLDTPDVSIRPSGLPHHCGAIASLMMAITQAVHFGLLPSDPGQPWSPE